MPSSADFRRSKYRVANSPADAEPAANSWTGRPVIFSGKGIGIGDVERRAPTLVRAVDAVDQLDDAEGVEARAVNYGAAVADRVGELVDFVLPRMVIEIRGRQLHEGASRRAFAAFDDRQHLLAVALGPRQDAGELEKRVTQRDLEAE